MKSPRIKSSICREVTLGLATATLSSFFKQHGPHRHNRIGLARAGVKRETSISSFDKVSDISCTHIIQMIRQFLRTPFIHRFCPGHWIESFYQPLHIIYIKRHYPLYCDSLTTRIIALNIQIIIKYSIRKVSVIFASK